MSISLIFPNLTLSNLNNSLTFLNMSLVLNKIFLDKAMIT
ncbi:MAG: hypothetical protein A4E72_01293 [Syntrophus sp. PtaU1.Bin208]|nr:MAG: hypothetical protein A4E72_01293 [Syntrophus sp. PtaU1.Bin208]